MSEVTEGPVPIARWSHLCLFHFCKPEIYSIFNALFVYYIKPGGSALAYYMRERATSILL